MPLSSSHTIDKAMLVTESIPSKLEAIQAFIGSFIKTLQAMSIDEGDLFAVRLSLEEALVNAMKHGNKMNAASTIGITAQLKKDTLELTIKDRGEGFDHQKLSDPTQKENIDKLSGRGVHLMKNLMDTVEFFDKGSGIRLVKSLKKGRQA